MLVLYSISFLTQIFKFDYYHISQNRIFYNSFSELGGQLVFLLFLLFFFVKIKSITILIICYLLQFTITALISSLPLIKNKLISFNFDFKELKKFFFESSKLGISQKFEFITSSSILLILGLFFDKKNLAFFSASYKVYQFLLILISSLSLTLMPKIFRSIEFSEDIKKTKKLLIIFLVSGIVLGSFTIFASSFVVNILFGEKYQESIQILRWFGFVLFLWPMIMYIGLIFISLKKYNYYLLTTFLTAIISIIFSLLVAYSANKEFIKYIFPSIAVSSLLIHIIFFGYLLKTFGLKLKEIF